MAGCGEQRVDLIAVGAEQVVPTKPAVVFGMADHRLDGGAASEFAFHGRRETALVAGDHDLGFAVIAVAAITLVDVEALDREVGHLFGLGGRGVQRVGTKSRPNVSCFLILDELVQHLDEIAAENTSTEQTMRGCKVRMTRKATKGAADRRSVVAKLVATSLKNVVRRKNSQKENQTSHDCLCHQPRSAKFSFEIGKLCKPTPHRSIQWCTNCFCISGDNSIGL